MGSEHFSPVARDIATLQLPPNTVALWWLGQASIALKSADTTMYIDPFLSEYPGRLIPPPFAPSRAVAKAVKSRLRLSRYFHKCSRFLALDKSSAYTNEYMSRVVGQIEIPLQVDN